MCVSEEQAKLIKKLSQKERKAFIQKLIERIMKLQTSQPWDNSKPEYDELEDKSFQELCELLSTMLNLEELERIPPWPIEQHQRLLKKINGFRLFLTPRAYEILHSSPTELELMVYRKGIEIALGKYPNVFLKEDSLCTGYGYGPMNGLLCLESVWSKPATDPNWEGFILVYFAGNLGARNGDPHTRFLQPDKSELIEELSKTCLEVPVS